MDVYANPASTGAACEGWPMGLESMEVSINAFIADEESSVAERRRADREPVKVDARVRELGSEGCGARVLNISSTGFMAETTDEFEIGARVWLILPGRERANAVVRWSNGERIGAEFAEPIDTEGLLAR
jgi:hypothetical protein